jgi:hypothetical protein
MANLSLRGLDAPTLSRIKSKARRRKLSVNRLIIETLRQQYAAGDRSFDDLDALAGAWSKTEAAEFAAAIAPFAEIDAGLWAGQPKTAYRVKPAARRRAPK